MQSQKSSPQPVGQGRNYALDHARQLMDRFEQRLTLSNPNLIDRYLESKLHLRVRLLINASNVEFDASFKGKSLVGWNEKKTRSFNQGSSVFDRKQICYQRSDIDTCCLRANCEQQAVLLDVVKSVKHPEDVIPSLVWLERVDGVKCGLRSALYFSAFFGFVTREIVRDGEVDPFGIRGSIPRITANQLECEMVEGRRQILDSISRDERQGYRDSLGPCQIADKLCGPRIVLGSNFIRVGLMEGVDFPFQILDVLFGPFDF